MASDLYQDQMNQQGAMMGQFNDFIKNPMQFLLSKRINIPSQYANDPKAAVNYLVQSGQMYQNTYQQFMNQAQMMGVKL